MKGGMKGGERERERMSAGRNGTINQNCRGMKIGAWGQGRMEEEGQIHKKNCIDTILKTPHKLL